jgi:Tfp pilus assembly protein PilE
MKIVSFFRKLKNREFGFTVAEMLVAVLVLGVLAAIAVPAYLNQRAVGDSASLKADLINASVNVEQSKVQNGGQYPSALPSGIVLQTANASLKYTHPYNGLAYCLQIIAGSQTLFKSNTDTAPNAVDCTFDYTLPTTVLRGTMPNNGYAPLLSWKAVRGATTYDIYKDNIKVYTYTVSAAEVNNIAFSQTLSAMNPNQTSVFYVVVGDGATTSAQSNTVSLTAPTPPPSAVTAKIIGSDVFSPTQQIYTISWNAVQYAQSYEVWDSVANQRIAQIPAGTLSYQYKNTRGTSTSVIVRALNTFGTSPDSNTLVLSSSWAKPVIQSAVSNPNNGTIAFQWQTGTSPNLTPDWGTPGYSVALTVTNATTSQVYTYNNITTPTYTPVDAYQRTTHTASIVVTTATGVTLQSDPVTITFPPPPAPSSVTGFTSDANGSSTIKNNRLVWTDSVCTQSSTPQYLITKLDNSMGNPNTGWITGNTWNIPDAQLAQATTETFQIQSRCSNGNGASSASAAVQTVFTTGILTPSSPAGLTNDHNFVASWTGVTCAAGLNAQYTLSQTKKNSAVVANTFLMTGTSQTFTDLTPGTDQTVAVMARCAKFGSYPDASTISASSSWSNYSSPTSWTTLLPAPAAPALTLTQTTVFSATQMTYQVSWNSVQWAQTYDVFNAANPGTPLTTVGNATTSATITVTRGTTMNVYVRAKNSDATGANSNTVALSSTWPTPVILSAVSRSYDGKIDLNWQGGTDAAPTPDWGTPGYSVQVNVKNLTTNQTYTYPNITARSYTTPDSYQRVDHSVTITVTTATGVQLTSAAVTVSFPPPSAPAAVTGASSNSSGSGPVKNDHLVWTAVDCGTYATPQYLVTNTTGATNSGWITGTVSGTVVNYDIPQAWLSQGVNEAFTISARCSNANGVSPQSADTSLSFKTSIVPPATPTNFTNNGVDTLSWNAVTTCAAGTTPYYNVVQTTQNGNPVNISFPTANTTLKLTGLSPATVQTAAVQALCQIVSTSTSSTWSALSATTTWTTPVPAPGAPVITAGTVTNSTPTQADFVINWAAVQWATTYEVHDAASGVLITTVSAPTTTATVRLTRGTSKNVVVVAVNVTGTSPNSNTLTLATTWPTPVILAANSQLDGTINFAWQTGTSPNFTPDWGTPGYSVVVKVTRVSDGLVAYTSPAITTSGVLTPAMPTREDYSAQITVTTATGVVLTSAPVTVSFPKPAAPSAPTGFTSDALGTGPIKNDRVTWNNVTCSTTGSTAYYYVSITSPTGKPAGVWQTSNVFNIPQTWLTQGDSFTFQLLAKCSNANGDSTQPPAVTTSFTTGIIPPNTPNNFRTGGTASVFWDVVTCASGYTPEYQITQTLLNNAASNLVYTTTSTAGYPLPGITAGANQSATLAARCDKTTTPTGYSSWSAPTPVMNWRAPLPQPGAPTITLGSSSVISPTQINFNISWAAVQYAEQYEIHNASDNSLIATVPSTTTVYGVTATRGVDKTVYVKAVNFSAGSVNSNSVTFQSPWATPAILSSQSNTSGQIAFSWQTGTSPNFTPDWGTPGYTVNLQVTRVSDGFVYNYNGLTTPSYTPSTVFNRERHTATITVTTATGVVMTSAPVTVDFIFAQPPTTDVQNFASNATGPGPTHNDVLTWNAVTCPTVGSAPQYYISQTTPANNSGWVSGTSFTIPQAWIQQGVSYTFNIKADCVDGNGPSLTTTNPVSLTYATSINTPAAPANLVNDTQSTVSWAAVTCPSNLVAGYQVTVTKQNGVTGSWVYDAGTNTTYTIAGLTPDTDQVATVQSRCYMSTNTAVTSAWSAQATATSWHIPMPVPVAPVNLHINSTTLAPTTATYNIGWNSVQWAQSYTIYDAQTLAVLGTVTSPTVSTNITVTRGTAKNVMVRASNVSGSSPNSNTVVFDSSWPTPVIQSATANADGTVSLTWQTGTGPNYTPDWGNPGYSVQASVTRTSPNTFYSPKQIGTGFSAYGNNLFPAGDANRDGKPDLMGINPSVGSGTAYFMAGNGASLTNTSDASGLSAPYNDGTGWNIFDTVIGGSDFTGDGNYDYIGRKPSDGSLWLYSGTNRGEIGNSVNIGTSGWGIYTTLFTGDYNGDGKGDVIGIKADGTMWFYAGNGASALAGGVQVGTGWNAYSQVINAGDYNNDGKNDIIAVKSDGTAYLFNGNGTGGVTGPIKQIASGWNIYDKIVTSGDFNGDGQKDIIARKPDGTLWLIPGPVDKVGATGPYTYTSPAVNGPSFTTPAMPTPDGYTAQITVTTATGVQLTSAPVTVSAFPKPAPPTAAATNITANGNARTYAATPNRVQWLPGTCAAGSWPEYNILEDRKNNVLGNYANSGWVTSQAFDYRDDMLAQGSTLSAVISTRCTNQAGSSSVLLNTTYVVWTTAVDLPAVPAVWNDSWGRLSWNTTTCPANTTAQYRAVQDVTNGANNQIIFPFQTGTYQDLGAQQGYPQAAHVTVKCVGPNAESGLNWGANSSWTSFMGPPTGLIAGAGTYPYNCGYRIACWNASCAAGGTVYYVWAVRDTNGVDIWSNYAWGTGTFYSNQGTAWGTGTVNVSARCQTPYATSPQAGVSTPFP